MTDGGLCVRVMVASPFVARAMGPLCLKLGRETVHMDSHACLFGSDRSVERYSGEIHGQSKLHRVLELLLLHREKENFDDEIFASSVCCGCCQRLPAGN